MTRFKFVTFLIAIQLFQQLYVSGQYGPVRGHTMRVNRGDQPPPPDTDYPEGDTLHPLAEVFKYRQPYGHHGYTPIKLHPCEQSSCYPATGNLLIGRESQLYASSTCGLNGPQRYCIVSHLEDRKKCFLCDSRPTNKPNPLFNHNISNIVYRMYPGTREKSWWQSENGKENVFIQLDLEAEFHFTHLIITFKTFRPAAMLIERSYDFKQTWHVYRYFAHNCAESFPGIRKGSTENLTDVVCESRYSDVAPSTGGEIIYRVLPPTLHIDNPYSEQVQNLLKMTNLRINFTKLHTLGDDLLDRREEIQEKYYYAITDMVVRGSCSCYGHANRCLPFSNIDPKPDMVHGRCECAHNTKGKNCERCEDFFNDLPWRPAIGKQTNACKKCNCNNHATSCHFDPAVYNTTGRVSGGVCDDCQHNTMGSNCELCKPFYYRDPNRDIQDPEVCQPCDCDDRGSLDEGICDSKTDPVNNLIAGSCHCKTNVEGRRCDSCKNGFWNFTKENPEGCQPCTCNTEGTIGNQGCNVYTGECTCKRYVTGHDCNQCLPEYWGLSDKKDGCQPCDCDPGGSQDNNCDVISGQCKCRSHMSGRMCDTPKQQHYTASLDFLLYEAELAEISSNCQIVIREPYRDGSPVTWTGSGFTKVFEKSFIEFIVDNIQTSTNYEIVIRYEPTTPDNWEDVQVTLIRPENPDYNSYCQNSTKEETMRVVLPSNSRSATVLPPVCLEAGKIYKVRLSFRRSNFNKESPSASVLIDSIVVMPRIDSIPWFTGTPQGIAQREEFEKYQCHNAGYQLTSDNIPEVCKKYAVSIGAYIFNGALSCQCDPTGSVSKLCNEYGGYCTCKPNVVGRRCDRCAPGTYGFGPEGCRTCDCNSIGALDNFCNSTTGQCKCRANTYGRECDQCRIGFWNFPNCQRCNCNGHADTCDSRTGSCINCRDNTKGYNCENCVDSFYGDPRLNVDIPCRPCPCPGVPGSNHSYAERCNLDPYTKDVVCECQEGYAGSRCDVCSDNFYGNPEVPGGECRSCECNDKIDLFKPGNCDPHTGVCKQCLFDTTGDHCEICRPGFFRLSPDRPCEPCGCHLLGTNSSRGACDHTTGQCPCLPNVTGLHCDECIPNHWKIASNEGCEPCNCDPQGSQRPQCNLYEGQCDCKPGFGGRQCNECVARFYGDPKTECKECRCDIRGSRSLQCHMKTGACLCRPGIGGYNCDVCDRGYIGESPDCVRCGECFDNWDNILKITENQTLDIISRAENIKSSGAAGAYTKEFDDMQAQLDDVEQMLNNTDQIDVGMIENDIRQLRNKIDSIENGNLKQLDSELADNKESMLLSDRKLKDLKNRMDEMNNKIKELEQNGTQLQAGNLLGALFLIENAKEKANKALQKAESTKPTINYAERQCKATESLMNVAKEGFQQQLQTNRQDLEDIKRDLEKLDGEMPDLNHLICDGQGAPCDSICGGAGCGNCGSLISCEDGAKQQAEAALSFANSTEQALKNKEAMANDFIRNVSLIEAEEIKQIANTTYVKAKDMLSRVNNSLGLVNNLDTEIRDFLAQNNTKPKDIMVLSEQVLATKIHLEPDEIKQLADDIKKAVDLLKNTDPIIEATRDDLRRVNQLKDNALNAKLNATKILSYASDVNDVLNKTVEAQKDAQKAIDTASNDTKIVHELLYKIGNETNDAQNQTGTTQKDLDKIGNLLEELQSNITDNGIYANRVINESVIILDLATKTYDDFNTLQVRYNVAKQNLTTNANKVKSSKERASDLSNRALNLVAKVTKTQEDITKLENNVQDNDLRDLEKRLQALIARMNDYTTHIEQRVKHYKICN